MQLPVCDPPAPGNGRCASPSLVRRLFVTCSFLFRRTQKAGIFNCGISRHQCIILKSTILLANNTHPLQI